MKKGCATSELSLVRGTACGTTFYLGVILSFNKMGGIKLSYHMILTDSIHCVNSVYTI